MSRGHGVVQREILQALSELPNGQLLLVGDGGWAYRRAAHKLAAEGLVSLVRFQFEGRQRLAVQRLSPLDRLLRARAARDRV